MGLGIVWNNFHIELTLLYYALCSALLYSALFSSSDTEEKNAQFFCEYAILSIQFENVMYRLKYYFIPYNSKTYRIHSEQHPAAARNCEILSRSDRPTDRTTQYILVCTNFNCFADSIFFLLVDFSLSIYIPIECNSVFVLNVCVRKLIIYYTGSN